MAAVADQCTPMAAARTFPILRGDIPKLHPDLRPMQDNPPGMNLLERQAQLDALTEAFANARSGSGKLLLIAGEAGLGKSSLVEQFVAAIRQSARILWGACDALDTPRALGPVHEIAAQTAILEEHVAVAGESRDWLFGALFAQLMPPNSTSVVVLEDVHWADPTSLELFTRTADLGPAFRLKPGKYLISIEF